jgi:hypothetical protein
LSAVQLIASFLKLGSILVVSVQTATAFQTLGLGAGISVAFISVQGTATGVGTNTIALPPPPAGFGVTAGLSIKIILPQNVACTYVLQSSDGSSPGINGQASKTLTPCPGGGPVLAVVDCLGVPGGIQSWLCHKFCYDASGSNL